MGPVQGAIVNWCGHKYGYANFKNGDHSKNSEPWGIFLLGELFQNNHHKDGKSPNFAQKWFEWDPTFTIMRLMHAMRIIRLKPVRV
jgi:stearoyl-CoA desaturase (delta-9 desaturase)